MTGILTALGGLVNFLGGLFTGGLAQLVATLTENLVTVGLLVFAVALGFFAIAYLNRRRKTLDQERLAALIKGLHRAGVSQQVLAGTKADARDHLVSGLRWLFGGVGASSALYGYEALQPATTPDDALRGALIGLVPAALGLAHLLCSWLSKYAPAPPAATSLPRSSAGLMRAAYRPYRAAGRRF